MKGAIVKATTNLDPRGFPAIVKAKEMESTETPGDPPAQIVPVMQRSWVGKDMEKERNLQDTRVMEAVEIVTEVEKTIEKSGVQEGNGSGKLNESWRQVAEKTIRSPWKSPKELQFGQVTITPSTYAALQNLEDSREEDTSEPSEDVVEEGNGIEKPKVVESEEPVGVRAGNPVGVSAGKSSRSESWLPSRSES
ncbi:hypothetical protein HID58_014580 [Brassica napus]|uniref:Peroxin-14 n=1 Tax=Brassica napus TaxID=3708 RepID=A0ABQ8DJD6_BRANA|nr:hypothetical protein HID58_014580 [Brassica napus]